MNIINLTTAVAKMPGKKNTGKLKHDENVITPNEKTANTPKESRLTTSSGVSFNQHVVKEVVETVLNKSNILQQSLIKAKRQSTSNFTEAADCPSKSNAAESCLLLQQLENDTELLNIISNKLSKAIMSNEIFRQLICDAISLEMREEITSLRNEMQETKIKYEMLEAKLEKQAQYSRRNCLIIYGKPIEEKEDTDKIVVDLISNKLGVLITKSHLDRSHRLRSSNLINPIIVKFISYNIRNLIYQNKRKLKGSGITISEALTSERRALIKRLSVLRKDGLIQSYWTQDGNIFYSLPNDPNKKVFIDSLRIEDLDSKIVR